MRTGPSTGRRNPSGVLALALAALAILVLCGCGKKGQDEAETKSGSLVPGEKPDTAVVDTTVPEVSESAYVAGTLTETGGVSGDSDTGTAADPGPAIKEVPQEKPAEVQKKPREAETRPATSSSSGSGEYSLQLGSFTNQANARSQAQRIRDLGYSPVIEESNLGGQTYHRVMLRGVGDMAAASELGELIHSKLGIAYLVRRGN